jgi:hypothetical protein
LFVSLLKRRRFSGSVGDLIAGFAACERERERERERMREKERERERESKREGGRAEVSVNLTELTVRGKGY